MGVTMKKGVIIEFDFAVLNGASLLYETTANLLKANDIAFDPRVEATYLAGGHYLGGLTNYFADVGTKKTPQKAARELGENFAAAVTAALPAAVTTSFKSFVRSLAEKDLKVVIATRANLEKVEPLFADILGENVQLYQEISQCYGSLKWDGWRRACVQNRLRNLLTVAVTGSGYGVKSALMAGMGSVAVTNDHVAYQDFGGADEVVTTLNAAAAKAIFRLLRVD